jgi:NAD(P)-dependent dehydrogenase (short-subunit alcohol dehydrogenase family)
MSSPKTLITGAASGIGRAVAERLAADGHSLVLVDTSPLDDLCAGHDGVVRLPGDVTDESFWNGAEPRLEGLTHALINACVAGNGLVNQLDFAEWRRILSVNLDGAFLSLRSALRAIKRSDGPRSIVLTASIAGLKPEPGIAAYAASKAGVIQLMKVAAKEVAAEGIRVNAIAPGGVDTPIWDGMPFFEQLIASEGSREAAVDAMAKMATPLGRYATADEIAGQIAFLLSDAAANITGALLTSDGGYSL